MNITMTNVVFVDQRNNQHSFESYFVPARTIRYIHVPGSVSSPFDIFVDLLAIEWRIICPLITS